MINKKKLKNFITAIRAILFYDWDPIGINCVIKLCDEYDSYVYRIASMLLANDSTQDIVKRLKNMEEEEIECKIDDDVRYKVAVKLQSLKKTHLT